MRFFSNEAKDNVDDQDVRADAVPQQRPGSPWGDRPGESTDAVESPEDRERANQDTVAWPAGEAPAAATPVDERDGSPDHEVDVPLDDRPADERDDFRADEDFRTGEDSRADKDFRTDEDFRADKVGEAIEDRGTFDDPHVAGDEDRADESRVDGDRADGDRADADLVNEDRRAAERADGLTAADDEFDDARRDEPRVDPVVVDAAESPRGRHEADPVDEPFAAEPPVVAVAAVPEPVPVTAVAEPVPAPVATSAPAATTTSGPASFFPESETQPLRDRWREIQLRFVDDPKAVTGEAAALVDETIEKLTASLRDHRGSLSSGGDDTEALRVELRSYRDILDRLLGL